MSWGCLCLADATVLLNMYSHANVSEDVLTLGGVQELGKHLPGVQERVTLVEMVVTAVTTAM